MPRLEILPPSEVEKYAAGRPKSSLSSVGGTTISAPGKLSTNGEIDFSEIESESDRDVDQDLLRVYLEEIGRYPLLTSQQEKLLFTHFRQGASLKDLVEDEQFQTSINPNHKEKFQDLLSESKTIRDVIANCNLKLVVPVAKKYNGLTLLDRIQEGNTGILRAIETFDLAKGFQFSTYATWWIKQKIMRAIADQDLLIRLPVGMGVKVRRAARIETQFEVENGRRPTRQELAGLLEPYTSAQNMSVELVLNTFYSRITKVDSLDKTIGDDEELTLADFKADPDSDTADQAGTNVDSTENIARALRENLNPRQQRIIMGRFGIGETEEMTLQELGDTLDLTRERVRQIEAKALKRLRTDQKLQELWSQDMPSYAYHVSAEEAALRMGLLLTDEEKHKRKAKKTAQKKEAREAWNLYRSQLDTLSTERPSQIDSVEAIHQVLERAKQNPEIWNQITEQERSILPLYYRSNSGRETVKDRLAVIFGMTTPELEVVVDGAIERIGQLLKADLSRGNPVSLREQVKNLRNRGLNNIEIADRLDRSLKSVRSAASALVQSGEVLPIKRGRHQVKPGPKSQGEILEQFIIKNPEISFKEMAKKSGTSLTFILQWAAKLRKRDKTLKRLSNGDVRSSLREYLKDNGDKEFNFRRFARRIGTDPRRVQRIYEKLREVEDSRTTLLHI